MTILATFPGKYGDLIWALPTLRALSRRVGAPVDLVVAAPFASICPLLEQQDYIGRCSALASWAIRDTAPMTPRVPVIPYEMFFDTPDHPERYDAVLHLGYRGWPQRPLPFETLDCLNDSSQIAGSKWTRVGQFTDAELDLQTPWITVPHAHREEGLVVGFTDEWVELKMGVLFALGNHWPGALDVLTMPDGRQDTEWGGPCTIDYQLHFHDSTWDNAAWHIANTTLFLGCNSALHVLAVAIGTPVVLMEPSTMRHHPIFYPLGTAGPQVTLVRGGDSLPTFDARAVRDTLTAVLAASSVR